MPRRSRVFALASTAVALMLACDTGITTGSGSDAGLGEAEGSARSDAGPPSVEQGCTDLYDALVAWSACAFQLNAVGDRTRYLAFCESRLGAPGVPSETVSAAETCASALQAAAPTCAPLQPDACAVPAGSLSVSAACGTAMQ